MTEETVGKKSPAVEVAKTLSLDSSVEVTLSTGYLVILKPVAASLIDEAVAGVKSPTIPTWFNEAKGRDEENPQDPAYLQRVEDYDRQRGLAAIDAMVMFGVELVDGVPDDDWIKKLKFLEKHGRLDLKAYNLKDDFEAEFLFKRYVAMSAEDLAVLSQISGVNQEDVAEAIKSFRRK